MAASRRRDIPGADRRGRGRCRRLDAVDRTSARRGHRSPLRRLGRRRPGGDRQARLPALHGQVRHQGRAGNVRRRERDHHQDQDRQGGRLPDRPFVRRQLLHQICRRAATTRRSTRPTSRTWPTCCGHDRAVPQDHAEAVGRALRLRHHRHRLQHHGDLARGGQGKGRQPAGRHEICRQDRRLCRHDDARLVRGAADRPGSEQHQGHGRGLGQGARDPRHGQEVLELGRRADGPSRPRARSS